MKPPEPKKRNRAPVEKQHYWYQLDFLVRADTLESGMKRIGMLFRKAYRKRLTLSDTLIYMGGYGATCRGGLAPKRPPTFHNQVKLVKGLPSVPGKTVAEQDADDAAKQASREKRRKTNEAVQAGAAAIETAGPPTATVMVHDTVVSIPLPTDETVVRNLKAKKKLVKKASGLAGLLRR